MSLFAVHEEDGSVRQQFQYVGPPADLPLLMASPTPLPPLPPPGTMSALALKDFKASFANFSGGAFSSFTSADWDGLVVAGGAVTTCLTRTVDRNRWRTCANADVDIFIVGGTEAQALRRMRRFCAIPSIKQGATFVRTPNTVSIASKSRRNLQIVLRIYPDVASILAEFDIDSCALAFDGTTVYATERSRRALTTRVNLVDTAFRSWS